MKMTAGSRNFLPRFISDFQTQWQLNIETQPLSDTWEKQMCMFKYWGGQSRGGEAVHLWATTFCLCITKRIVAAQELWSERSYCFFSLKGMWGFYSHWLVPYHIFPGALEQNNFPLKTQWLESVYLVHSNQTSLKGKLQFVKHWNRSTYINGNYIS